MLPSPSDLQTLLAAPAPGEGLELVLENGRFERLDPARFHSNVPAEVFTSQVLANTGGRFFLPPRKVYRLPGATMSPLVPKRDYWPELMFLHTNRGRLVRDLLPRTDKGTNRPYTYGALREIPGTCVYLGMFMPYFGHFLSEVVSRFWLCDALRGRDVTWVFHAHPNSVEAWSRDSRSTRMVESILETFGIRREDMAFLTSDTVFEDVICPSALNVYTRGYNPGYLDIAARIRRSLPEPEGPWPQRIFLSRSRFNGRNLVNAAQIETIFTAHGFTIIHPQEHDLATQAGLAAHAEVIAGEEGSAFCNVMFADNPLIIELESGRFHPNLPRLSNMVARRYCYLLPYHNITRLGPVRMKNLLYAHPWVVDETLAEFLGTRPAGEAVCGPRECAELYEEAFLASLTLDAPAWIRSVETLADRYQPHFSPDIVLGLKANFEMAAHQAA